MDWFRVFIRFAISNIVFGAIILIVFNLIGFSKTIGILLVTFSSTFYTCMEVAKKENKYFTEKDKLIALSIFVLTNLTIMTFLSSIAVNRTFFEVSTSEFFSFIRIIGIIHTVVIYLAIQLVKKLYVYESIKQNEPENLSENLLKNKKNILIVTAFILFFIHLLIGLKQFNMRIVNGESSYIIENLMNFRLYSSAIWSNFFFKIEPFFNILIAVLWSFSIFNLFRKNKYSLSLMKKTVIYSLIFYSISTLLKPIAYFSLIFNFSSVLSYISFMYTFPGFFIVLIYSFILYKGYQYSKIYK